MHCRFGWHAVQADVLWVKLAWGEKRKRREELGFLISLLLCSALPSAQLIRIVRFIHYVLIFSVRDSNSGFRG